MAGDFGSFFLGHRPCPRGSGGLLDGLDRIRGKDAFGVCPVEVRLTATMAQRREFFQPLCESSHLVTWKGLSWLAIVTPNFLQKSLRNDLYHLYVR